MSIPFIFILYVGLCLLFLNLYNTDEKESCNKEKRNAVIIMAVGAILIGGLRSPFWGSGDVGLYKYYFERDMQLPIEEICERSFSDWHTDESYYVLAKLFSLIIPNFQIWLFVLCSIFIISCAALIFKWSKNPPLSFIYLIFMDNYMFTWCGLKQNLALSLCIWSFMLLERRKYILFTLLTMVAFTFHISTFVFLLALVAFVMPVKYWNLLTIAGCFFISVGASFLLREILFLLFGNYVGISSYIESTEVLNLKMYLLLLVLYLIFFSFRKNLQEQNKINSVFINMSMLGVCLQGFSYVIAEFFRCAYFFTIFNMLLIGNISVLECEKTRRIVIQFFLIVFLVIIFLARGGCDYSFFWEEIYLI